MTKKCVICSENRTVQGYLNEEDKRGPVCQGCWETVAIDREIEVENATHS